MPNTHSEDHGTTFRFWIFGSTTDDALHGFLAINSSSTAAAITVDTCAMTTLTNDGASCFSRVPTRP